MKCDFLWRTYLDCKQLVFRSFYLPLLTRKDFTVKGKVPKL